MIPLVASIVILTCMILGLGLIYSALGTSPIAPKHKPVAITVNDDIEGMY